MAADLVGGYDGALPQAHAIRAGAVYCRCRVRENGALVATLLSLVGDPQRSVDRVDLGVVGLFAQVQGTALPACPLPPHRRSHLEDTRVGCWIVTQGARRPVGGVGQGGEGEEGGPGPP